MNEYFEQAKAKLEEGFSKGSFDKYGAAMKAEVRDAMLEFCRQDGEFAQAVAQGGSFADCMKAVAKGCGSSISDLAAYRKAAQFYFPGADIRMSMEIDLCASVRDGGEKKAGIVLDLADFF
jgi:hypothetical protein